MHIFVGLIPPPPTNMLFFFAYYIRRRYLYTYIHIGLHSIYIIIKLWFLIIVWIFIAPSPRPSIFNGIKISPAKRELNFPTMRPPARRLAQQQPPPGWAAYYYSHGWYTPSPTSPLHFRHTRNAPSPLNNRTYYELFPPPSQYLPKKNWLKIFHLILYTILILLYIYMCSYAQCDENVYYIERGRGKRWTREFHETELQDYS